MARWKKGQSGNPKGRPPKKSNRADGWSNLLSGLGTTKYDRRVHFEHCTEAVGYEQARDLWRGDDIAARIIETVPNEMTRQGWSVQIAEEAELQETVEKKLEALDSGSELWLGAAFERAYGGAATLLGVNDGSADLSKPLAMDRIKSFDWMTTFEASEVIPVQWYTNPAHPKFGKPELYQVAPSSPGGVLSGARNSESEIQFLQKVHESRFLIWPGIRVTRREITELAGWGDSIMTRVWAVLRDFNSVWGSAGHLVTDFAQAVFKIAGLAELLANQKEDAGKIVKTRMEAVNISRSTARAILLDAEEEFERKQTPLSGLPELLDRFATRLAAAADMPLTLLMGQSPAGLNATGESDIRLFYDRISAMQDRKLRPHLEKLVEICMAVEGFAGEKEPESWSVLFNPLWQPTEKEQAEAREVQAKVDATYITHGVLSPDEVAESRFGGDDYSFETVVDFDERDRLALEAQREQEILAPNPDPNQPSPPDTDREENTPEREENGDNPQNNPERENEPQRGT